ncbi:hypothetical protein AEQU3_00966 [Aequorivita antarctica]|nr:hypothetical protein AEQU3_00966 [Aequorivita antarctica]
MEGFDIRRFYGFGKLDVSLYMPTAQYTHKDVHFQFKFFEKAGLIILAFVTYVSGFITLQKKLHIL